VLSKSAMPNVLVSKSCQKLDGIILHRFGKPSMRYW
jgi:hypothetical protein